MSSKPAVLIFGAGANIGAALVKKFIGAGYRVAAVSRSAAEPATPSDDGTTLSIRADLSDPSQVPIVFDKVLKTWHSSPEVVIWNAGSKTNSPDRDNVFSIPVAELDKAFAVMATSPWVAAAEATKSWGSVKGTFIVTGNHFPRSFIPSPDFATLGAGKSAVAHWLGVADLLYKEKGWRFFFADERSPEGKGVGPKPGAESHAEMYLSLVRREVDVPYYVTFLNGKYHEF